MPQEPALSDSALFKFTCELSPFGIFVTDAEGECVYSNLEYHAISGLSAGETSGSGWMQSIHPGDRTRISEYWFSASGGVERFSCEYRIMRKDGTVIHALSRSVPIEEDNRHRGFMHVIEDITLRLRMESQLRINFAAMESSDGMVMITDRAGIITWINPAFSRGTGYSFSEIVGTDRRVVFPGEAASFDGAIQSVTETGMPWKGESPSVRKDGTGFLGAETVTPVLGGDGEISHFLVIQSDVTEQRENERKLKRYSENLENLVRERTRELVEAQQRILLQRRIEQDLEFAMQIQKTLLPEKPPVIKGYEIASESYPARYISGDLFDFIEKGRGTLYILIADISGKGIPAALLTASARTTVREKILQRDSPAEILDLVNRTLHADLDKTEMFVTMMLAKLDLASGLVTYSNAGHTETMRTLAVSRTIRRLGPTSIPVGVFPDIKASERRFFLNPGDVLFLYSDGLTEATDADGKLLGEDALEAVLSGNTTETPRTILDRIVATVTTHTDGAAPDDDRSIVVIKRCEGNGTRAFTICRESFEDMLAAIRETAHPFSGQFVHETEIVMTEHLTNVIRHAYGIDVGAADFSSEETIRIDFRATADSLVMETRDNGKPFGGASCKEPDPEDLREGGYGYSIICRLAASVEYERESDGTNLWRIEMREKGQK